MNSNIIRLAIVDDHKLFRDGIAGLLGAYKDLYIDFKVANGIDFFEELDKRNDSIDVVLLDLEMPEMDGLAVLRKLKETNSKILPLIVTMHNEDEIIYELVELGAKGLLAKNADIEEVVEAIRIVYDNELYFNEDVSKILIKRIVKKEQVKSIVPNKALTEREKEIIRLICNELTIKEIAEELSISERTVDTHKTKIFEKTKTRNSAGIVMYAVKTGIVG
jgi:two-component system response regulator DegU